MLFLLNLFLNEYHKDNLLQVNNFLKSKMLFILRRKLKLQICKQIYKMKNEFKKDSQSIK